MSMISAQCDELRTMAVSVGMEIPQAATLMMSAADAIDSLDAENGRLRELVLDMYLCSDETCTDCEHHDYSGDGFWCKRGVGWKKARMRELGIEVKA